MKSPEMIRTNPEKYDYFVVAKIDKNQIHLIHHTDARPAQERKNPKTGDEEPARELISMAISGLKDLCVPSPDEAAEKVRPRKVQVKVPSNRRTSEGIQFLVND